MMPRGGLWVAALVFAAAADLYVALRPDPEALSEEAMRAGAAATKEAQKPGDVLVHSPLFRVSELAALGELKATPQRPAPKLAKSRRVLVLDRRDRPMYLGLGEEKEVRELGPLVLRIFEPAGAVEVPLYELRDALLPATMRVERPLGTVASRCTQRRDEGGWSCPKEAEWIYAQARVLHIDGEDAPCVWAHPVTAEGAVVFEIPAQSTPPEGRKLELTVSAALTDDAVKLTGDGAPVTTAIVQGGRERARLMVPNRIGWQRSVVAIEPGQPVELRITTPRDGRRHHCINASIVEKAAAKEKP